MSSFEREAAGCNALLLCILRREDSSLLIGEMIGWQRKEYMKLCIWIEELQGLAIRDTAKFIIRHFCRITYILKKQAILTH